MKIPNMRELVWSDDLAHELSIIFKCFYKHIFLFYYPLFEKIECNKVQDKDDMTTIWYMFLPGIAEEHRDRISGFKIETLFLESGEAGSKCDYGYEDNDGLCKYTGTTTVITTTATTTTVPTTTVTTTGVTTTTKKPAPNTPTASISVPNHGVMEDSQNDGSNEPSSSYSIFSMVHILVVLVFGYSIFT
ncbi:hypothetical protein L5515_015768 [Caenorhabditis briggsae]|uniref:Uncharacterized protein n=1 Tax=Caenorhabditis briggsae TaxID=6238 RepID=A0AAE9EG14_CAEBR|nr:hypothetical protein L5515_015768 [Caenorhabditis briggsae]